MERKQVQSSVIARLLGFGEQRRPFQPVRKEQKFLADTCQSKVAKIGVRGDKYSSKKEQHKIRHVSISETCKRAEQQKGLVEERNKSSISDFVVPTPTKDNFHDFLLQRPNSWASKRIIEAQATPPHRWKMGMKSTDFSVFGKTGNKNNRKFGRGIDRQKLNSKPKLKHHDSVDPLKLKFRKKESSLKGSVSGEIGPNSMFSASRKVSPGRIGSQTPATETRLKLISAPSFSKKDENYDFECPTSSEETYQPSPVSVLEPFFDGEMLEDLREPPYLNLLGLEQQLEALKSESMETYSEGSEMVLSSDEDSDEESVCTPKAIDGKNREEAVGSVGAQGSKEFAYVNTILFEAGFHETKQVSLDSPIDTRIFEKLEKKYCKQTSWKRSERKLLFDRVNSSLVEIQESSKRMLTWKKPVSRRLSPMLSIRGLKEELRILLATQEKQAKKESSTKVPSIVDDRWLKLDEEIESVVWELETSLEDELIAEVVGLE